MGATAKLDLVLRIHQIESNSSNGRTTFPPGIASLNDREGKRKLLHRADEGGQPSRPKPPSSANVDVGPRTWQSGKRRS